jgi:hypothetical protein
MLCVVLSNKPAQKNSLRSPMTKFLEFEQYFNARRKHKAYRRLPFGPFYVYSGPDTDTLDFLPGYMYLYRKANNLPAGQPSVRLHRLGHFTFTPVRSNTQKYLYCAERRLLEVLTDRTASFSRNASRKQLGWRYFQCDPDTPWRPMDGADVAIAPGAVLFVKDPITSKWTFRSLEPVLTREWVPDARDAYRAHVKQIKDAAAIRAKVGAFNSIFAAKHTLWSKNIPSAEAAVIGFDVADFESMQHLAARTVCDQCWSQGVIENEQDLAEQMTALIERTREALRQHLGAVIYRPRWD